MENKEKTTIELRQDKNKKLLLEQLKKTPIIQIACEKIGVGRASYYRWRKEDAEFAKEADTAIIEGSFLINDMAESQLMAAIRDRNLTAIIFWLKHHHSTYATKLHIDADVKNINDELTPEQESLIREALKLTSLTFKEDISNDNDKNQHE